MDETTPDGRATRWEGHNLRRRRELVEATLRAIRRHGAGVGMDEVAAEAGTSKTVIYRHFGGRTGLYVAVVESVHTFIHASLAPSLDASHAMDPVELVRQLADTYLSVVERDPEIYRFVLSPPAPDSGVDPYGGLPELIGAHVAVAIAEGSYSADKVAGTLADLCHGRIAGPVEGGGITLFKSVGVALEDLAAAIAVWDSRS